MQNVTKPQAKTKRDQRLERKKDDSANLVRMPLNAGLAKLRVFAFNLYKRFIIF